MKYALLAVLALSTLPGLSQQDKFVEILRANTYQLQLNDLKFDGPGAEILTEAISQSQFVMIGEQHGLAEVQQVSSGIYSLANAHGYHVFAIETDPFAAGRLTDLARKDESVAQSFSREFPMTIPFFHSLEGMQMAREIAAAGDGKTEFWGLDQVFVVGPRMLFAMLAERAQNDQSRNLAEEFARKAAAAFDKAMGTGKPDSVMLMQLTADDFDALNAAFEDDADAIELIAQMQLSRQIYQYWYDGSYHLNNSVRSDLMKRLFREQYQAEGTHPKVVFKMGSNHCIRGLTYTHIYDLGNMISELAAYNDTRSLHVKLTGAKGTSYNMLAGNQDFDNTEDWHEWISMALKDKLSTAGENLLVVDMRPLRNLRMKNVDEEIKSLVFGFDLWIILPEANPVTPIR